MAERLDGYLTVYIAMLLGVLLLFMMVLFTGLRKNTTLEESELALDTACNAALGEYHRELLNQYDLFFIDTAYETQQPDVQNVERHIRYYADANLQDTLFQDVETNEILIDQFPAAADQDCAVLEEEIDAYMRSLLGLDAVKKMMSYCSETVEEQQERIQILEQRDKNEVTLKQQPNPVRVTKKKVHDEKTGKTKTVEEREEVPIVNPAEKINGERSLGILSLTVPDVSEVSNSVVNLGSLFSERTEIMQGTGTFEHAEDLLDSALAKKVLLMEYIRRKCGNFREQKEKSKLKYQVEYLVERKASDVENLKSVVNELSMIREAANALFLFSDPEKHGEITAMASAVSAVALAPYLEPLLETSILFGWAYAESVQDVRILLDGGKVPLVKTAASWNTGLSSIFHLSDVGQEMQEGDPSGLDYESYLFMLLCMKSREDLLDGLMNVMEMDVRETPYNHSFRMDGCISGFELIGSFRGKAGYDCEFRRRYCYE